MLALGGGRLFAAGGQQAYEHDSWWRTLVARFRADGRLDLRFGTRGRASRAIGPCPQEPAAAAPQGQSVLLLGWGCSGDADDGQSWLVRALPNSTRRSGPATVGRARRSTRAS